MNAPDAIGLAEQPIHRFETRDDVARALAERIGDALREAIARRGRALLAVSGGNTPRLFMQALSRQDLDWSRVTVTLVDERWVERGSDRANATLVNTNLLTGPAAAAEFVDLYVPDTAIEDAVPILDEAIRALSTPFDAVALGMGTDGHTASFFPGGDGLDAAVDPAGQTRVAAVRAAAAGEPRVTLTLAELLRAGLVVLHIEGEEKLQVLETARRPGSANDLPIRHVLRNRPDLHIHWAP